MQCSPQSFSLFPACGSTLGHVDRAISPRPGLHSDPPRTVFARSWARSQPCSGRVRLAGVRPQPRPLQHKQRRHPCESCPLNGRDQSSLVLVGWVVELNVRCKMMRTMGSWVIYVSGTSAYNAQHPNLNSREVMLLDVIARSRARCHSGVVSTRQLCTARDRRCHFFSGSPVSIPLTSRSHD